MTNANPSAAEDKASLALIPAEGYPESHVILPLFVHPSSRREIQGLRAFNRTINAVCCANKTRPPVNSPPEQLSAIALGNSNEAMPLLMLVVHLLLDFRNFHFFQSLLLESMLFDYFDISNVQTWYVSMSP
jgi:hypothetical protein